MHQLRNGLWLGLFLCLVAGFGFAVSYTSPYSHQSKHSRSQQQPEGTTNPTEEGGPRKTFWERTRDDPVAYFTLWLTGFTGVLSVSTIGLWFVTWRAGVRQTRDMAESIRIADRAADLAERNLIATQRAFVHLKTIVATPVRDPNGVLRAFMIAPEWENSGTTPTRNLSINVNWTPYPGSDLPPGFSYAYGRPAARLFLGPKGVIHSEPINIPPAEYENAKRGAVRMFIWGRAEYADIFEGTQQHFTQFCFRIVIQSISGSTDWIAFSHFGDYNRSDEDI